MLGSVCARPALMGEWALKLQTAGVVNDFSRCERPVHTRNDDFVLNVHLDEDGWGLCCRVQASCLPFVIIDTRPLLGAYAPRYMTNFFWSVRASIWSVSISLLTFYACLCTLRPFRTV